MLEEGLTVRVAGLVEPVCVTPSDQVISQGPVPVNAACMVALPPGAM